MALIVSAWLGLSACDRGVAPKTRPIVVKGLPSCPGKETYARPLVVRLDRDRSLFDEAFTTQDVVPSPRDANLVVPRARMHATVRVGICNPTSLATWDCTAANWIATSALDLDARSTAAETTLPTVQVPCGPVPLR